MDVRSIVDREPEVEHNGTVPVWYLVQPRELKDITDGGFVELIDVQDNRVYLQMGGGCQGCGAADITLKSGIERLIKEEIPEVAEVLDTTDHSSGTNPYYTAGKA